MYFLTERVNCYLYVVPSVLNYLFDLAGLFQKNKGISDTKPHAELFVPRTTFIIHTHIYQKLLMLFQLMETYYRPSCSTMSS